MLSIRNAEAKDIEGLKAFMAKEGQFDSSANMDFTEVETMILTDEDTIYGYVMAALIDYKPWIEQIYIPEKLRKHLFGDAALRGMLFYLMNRGFEKTYARKNTAISDFLIHEGFYEGEEKLEIVMNDFFNQKCRGCKGNE